MDYMLFMNSKVLFKQVRHICSWQRPYNQAFSMAAVHSVNNIRYRVYFPLEVCYPFVAGALQSAGRPQSIRASPGLNFPCIFSGPFSSALLWQVRHDPQLQDHWPVMIHVNYHPDKFARMRAVIDYYVHGLKTALQPFPDGSE